MSDQSVCVYTASGEVEAQQVRAFLESHGIPSAFHGESLRKTHGFTVDGLGMVEILVPETHAERAGQLLAAADKGDFTVGEDDLLG